MAVVTGNLNNIWTNWVHYCRMQQSLESWIAQRGGQYMRERILWTKWRSQSCLILRKAAIFWCRYYIDKMKEFDITMNLDGLNSKYQMNIPIISKNGSVQLSPYQIRKYSVSFPKQLLHKRGVYIVDCILSGWQLVIFILNLVQCSVILFNWYYILR